VSNLSDAIKEVDTKEKNNPKINKKIIKKKVFYLYFSTIHNKIYILN
jgi:hypothetical protein